MPFDDDSASESWERERRLDIAHEQEPRSHAFSRRAPDRRRIAPAPTVNRATVYYTLDGDRRPVPCDDAEHFARWLAESDRLVARDEVVPGVIVSTVYLGVDHDIQIDGCPMLWETVVIGGEYDGERDRYESHELAERGHGHWLTIVRNAELRKL